MNERKKKIGGSTRWHRLALALDRVRAEGMRANADFDAIEYEVREWPAEVAALAGSWPDAPTAQEIRAERPQ